MQIANIEISSFQKTAFDDWILRRQAHGTGNCQFCLPRSMTVLRCGLRCSVRLSRNGLTTTQAQKQPGHYKLSVRVAKCHHFISGLDTFSLALRSPISCCANRSFRLVAAVCRNFRRATIFVQAHGAHGKFSEIDTEAFAIHTL
jgi:hypothetical protein